MTTKKWLERLKAKRQGNALILDRTETPSGTCELCGAGDQEVRPYGPKGEWICFDCAMKDEATTERQFRRVVLGQNIN